MLALDSRKQQPGSWPPPRLSFAGEFLKSAPIVISDRLSVGVFSALSIGHFALIVRRLANES
jgi:hypothetical protein